MTKPSENEQHVYHHYEPTQPKVNVKAERNSKGWNYEATVIGAASPEEAMQILNETVRRLDEQYGAGPL